jgi:endo-1,4-beta-xylanase
MPAGAAEPDGLAALAAARGVALGTMVFRQQLEAMPALVPLVRKEAAFIVPGLEMKWSRIHPEPGRFSFADADWLAGFARDGGLGLRGHTLVWHESLPQGLDLGPDAASARAVLRAHIRGVAGHFAGRLRDWDVVNEAIEPPDKQPGGLRLSPFLRALGPDYIPFALECAAEADPQARLVINDYDLELDARYQARRREAMLELLKGLVRRRAPLHAVGIQAHLAPRSAPFDAGVLRRFIRDIASLGLEVYVTELDIVDRLLPADTAARDAESAAFLRDFLQAVLSEKAVTRICLWGLTDRYAWTNDSAFARRKDGLRSRAHPYDEALRAKPDREAIAAALRDTPRPG